MLFISHRGNLKGPNPDQENKPDYVLLAAKANFEVEIDVWYVNNEVFLGNDKPQYKINEDFVTYPKFWCHAKNIEALLFLTNKKSHCFWHQQDDFTLTSNKFIWTYPGKTITSNSIFYMPEKSKDVIWQSAAGICTDYPEFYKSIY